MSRTIRLLACTGALVFVFAACGSSSGSKASPTTTKAKATTTTTAAAPKQTITITPAKGLTNGQMVTVVGKGFTPGAQNIGVNECADKGAQTGGGDCDLGGTKTAVPDASGTVTLQFAANKGPFGANAIICSATVKCLISVSQLTATPTEEASDNIEFAP